MGADCNQSVILEDQYAQRLCDGALSLYGGALVKNHIRVDGKLLQTNKAWGDL